MGSIGTRPRRITHETNLADRHNHAICVPTVQSTSVISEGERDVKNAVPAAHAPCETISASVIDIRVVMVVSFIGTW